MQLICENIDDVEFVTENVEGVKNYYIEGIFLQGNLKNRNGRIYPTEILDEEVQNYTEKYITSNRAYGELGHPDGPGINLDRISHMIKELYRDGDNFIGKAKITTSTPMGKIAASLLDEGANLGVSSRGMGSLVRKDNAMIIQNGFKLATAADIVADPSAPDAFVKGIMEGAEWVWDIASGCYVVEDELHKMHESAKKKTVKQLDEEKGIMYQNFIKALGKV